MNTLQGRVAAITGAASGIGRELAYALTQKGCHVALADVDEAGLQETAQQVQTLGGHASVHRVDVSDEAQVQAFADATLKTHGAVHLLFNNAGVTYSGTFLEHDRAQWDRILGTNLMGVIYGCRAFLPHLLAADEAHIINISSIFGIIGVPGQSAYCTSKFAVRGFSESLWIELSQSQVGVTVVHPGGIATGIAANSGYANPELKEQLVRAFKHTMPPAIAARQILQAVEEKQPRVLITKAARWADWMKRIMPNRANAWFGNAMKKDLKIEAYEESVYIRPPVTPPEG